jgi:hypothetical protein
MEFKVDSIVYNFRQKCIIVYGTSEDIHKVYYFSNKQGSIFPRNTWIQILDSEVESLSHNELIYMIRGNYA